MYKLHILAIAKKLKVKDSEIIRRLGYDGIVALSSLTIEETDEIIDALLPEKAEKNKPNHRAVLFVFNVVNQIAKKLRVKSYDIFEVCKKRNVKISTFLDLSKDEIEDRIHFLIEPYVPEMQSIFEQNRESIFEQNRERERKHKELEERKRKEKKEVEWEGGIDFEPIVRHHPDKWV